MNVQGRLTDSTGSPLPAGFKEFSFSIYTTEVGGILRWGPETQFVTSDVNGLWTAKLGDVDSVTLGVFSSSKGWLEISVDDGVNPPVTLPRVELMTNPYTFVSAESDLSDYAESSKNATNAVYADTAEFALSSLPDGDWLITDTILYTADSLGISRGNAGNQYIGDDPRTSTNFGVACTTGGSNSFIGGGYGCAATGDRSVIGGGNTNKATSLGATVGGGQHNEATAGNATVAGGFDNVATNSWSTVGGGIQNKAEGFQSFVGGGASNRAIGAAATVAGGGGNQARGAYSVISGGGGGLAPDTNSAFGDYATVPGGRSNRAAGVYSFAGGYNAHATHDGAFVWAGSGDFSVTDELFSTNSNSFTIWASGGATFYSGEQFNAYTGVRMAAGGGAWSSVCDRNAKFNIQPIDGADLLDKVAELPITRWSYRTQDSTITHIGPMAQDFYRLFEVGEDNKSISTLDPDGIALAAIKELHQRNKKLEEELTELRNIVEKLERD